MQSADLAHHVRGGDGSIKVDVASLDFRNQVVGTDDFCASFFGGLGSSAFGENSNANFLTGAVRQGDHAAELLVCLTGVDAKAEVDFDGLVELSGRNFLDEGQSLERSIELACFDFFGSKLLVLREFHVKILSW